MPIFSYKAKTPEGKTISGSVEAVSSSKAAAVLRRKGWVVVSIGKKQESFNPLQVVGRIRGVSGKSRVVFTRQLATMLEAGLPLTQCLDILSQQVTDLELKKIVEDALSAVQGGAPLSKSFERYPRVFSRIYVSLIRAGEASGSLDKILLRLADTQEKSQEFRGKVKGAMIYPAIVITTMFAVFAIIMLFVMPKLTGMYADLNTELPTSTKVLIAVSDFFVSKWWLLLLMMGGAVAGFVAFKRTRGGKYALAKLSLKIPVLGKLGAKSELAEFARTLSLLSGAGLPILTALERVSEGINNILFREAIEEATSQVARGVRLSLPLRSNPIFPPILSQMVAVGEETGKLPEVLGKLAVFFERETEQLVKNLTTALEPFIMIVLGVGVALLVLSIVMPIYNLTAQF